MGLDSVELVMEAEEHFEIEIANSEAEAIRTVGELRDLVCKKLIANGQRANPEVILNEVIDITSKITGIKKSTIGPNSRFIEDLEID